MASRVRDLQAILRPVRRLRKPAPGPDRTRGSVSSDTPGAAGPRSGPSRSRTSDARPNPIPAWPFGAGGDADPPTIAAALDAAPEMARTSGTD